MPRIVPLHGALAELILALDRGQALIARTEADAALLPHLPSIGTHLRPNLEAIVALRPDLVLTMADAPHEELLRLLHDAGIQTRTFPGSSFADIATNLRALGDLLDARAAAEHQIATMEATLQALAPPARRLRVLVELRYPNLLVSGDSGLVAHIITAAGGTNAVRAPEKLVRLAEEELLRLAPEVCVVLRGPMHPNPQPYSERSPIFAHLPCSRHGLVFETQQTAFSRPTLQAVQATVTLAQWLQHAARVLAGSLDPAHLKAGTTSMPPGDTASSGGQP